MKIRIEKGTASGEIKAPPSKSICHRLIIAAALAEGVSRLSGISLCRDCLATIDCLRALGVKMTLEGDSLTVEGDGFVPKKPLGVLDATESGSTLRFLIPLSLLSGEETVFVGSKRLFERPQTVYEEIARERGFLFEKSGSSLKVSGRLCAGEYRVRGDISSQFITGLLFALLKCEGESRIIITTELESRSYIDLTLDAITAFGGEVSWENDSTLLVKGGAGLSARELTVEGDFSGAAFIHAFNALGGKAHITGLNMLSKQGDRAYIHLYPRLILGAPEISIKDCPDLGPILFAVAAAKHGATFTDTARLRIKESDRAEAMAEELRKFGAVIKVYGNSVVIEESELHAPALPLSGHNDHRIVMALSVLLTLYGGEIEGAEAVAKSYENFFSDLEKLNITVKRYEA